MIINDAGRGIITTYEGCRLTAYKCPRGIWTIGYGHTGNSVKPGLRISQHYADGILGSDLERFEQAVSELCPNLNQNQFSACVSLVFNIGIEAFKASTLLQKIQAGDFQGAADEFPRWVHAGGQTLPGLVKRRAAERALFLEMPA